MHPHRCVAGVPNLTKVTRAFRKRLAGWTHEPHRPQGQQVNNGRAVHAIDNLQIVHIAHTVYAVIPSRTLFFAAQSNLYRNDA